MNCLCFYSRNDAGPVLKGIWITSIFVARLLQVNVRGIIGAMHKGMSSRNECRIAYTICKLLERNVLDQKERCVQLRRRENGQIGVGRLNYGKCTVWETAIHVEGLASQNHVNNVVVHKIIYY